MRSRTPVSLFPFLSVLLSTMGVLAFLAITFLLFANMQTASKPEPETPLEVRWVGAPPYVRPLLAEVRAGTVLLHDKPGGLPRAFPREALSREVSVVKELMESATGTLGPTPNRTQLWVYLKGAIPAERRLNDSLTTALHWVEMDNMTGRGRKERIERYPILLVYPDGVETYELAAYLVEMTTRLSMGVEPMLTEWRLPYVNLTQ